MPPWAVRGGIPDVEHLRIARRHYEQMYRNAGGVGTRGRVLRFLTEAAAHRAMRLAETAAGLIRADEEPDETGYVQPGLLETALADTLMRLGDTGPAQQYAAEAVAVQTHARGRVHRLATLADCELRGGEIDLAAGTAVAMLDTVAGMESHRLYDRLAGVRRNLAATRTASTREVVDRIDETLRIPL
ncbi:hypothetical protein [Streptomyces sp. NPDC088789]|uniref:hypothetical protein n=1 Tax=Streptomyces sp. NPDC088789 TaxID=3365899 RepID=UPI0037F22C9F